MEGSVPLVSEKRVCTGVETARSSKARAVIQARSRQTLRFARAVCGVARRGTLHYASKEDYESTRR